MARARASVGATGAPIPSTPWTAAPRPTPAVSAADTVVAGSRPLPPNPPPDSWRISACVLRCSAFSSDMTSDIRLTVRCSFSTSRVSVLTWV